MQNPIENTPDLYIMLFLNIKKGNPQACNINEPPHDKPTISLCVQQRLRSAWTSAQSDQSSLSAWRKLVSLATHWAQSKTDQTGRMSRLIWVFAGCTLILLVLSWGGSNNVIRDQLQGKHMTILTKLYIELHAFLYHQNINHTKEICFNDDALVALLPKGVCFVKYYFSSLRYRNFMWSTDQKNIFIPFN